MTELQEKSDEQTEDFYMEFSPERRRYLLLAHHEDNLIDKRLTWLIATQALFFAGYGVVLEKYINAPNDDAKLQYQIIVNILPIVAGTVSFLILLGIIAAIVAMYILRERFGVKHVGIHIMPTVLGLMPATIIPIVFIIAWVVLMIRY